MNVLLSFFVCISSLIPPFCVGKDEAIAAIHGSARSVSGFTHYVQTFSNGKKEFRMNGKVSGLTKNSKHGIVIFKFGDINKGCSTLGGHFDPLGVGPDGRPAGDLGFIEADDNGNSVFDMEVPDLSLCGVKNIMGRTVAVMDTYDGSEGDTEAIACGVIGSKRTPREYCVSGYMDCSHTDVASYPGKSVNECRYLCDLRPDCKSLAWSLSNNECWLKGTICANVERDPSTNIHYEVKMDAGETCLNPTYEYCDRPGFDCNGSDIKEIQHVEEEKCKYWCSQRDDCRSIQWRSQNGVKKCWLKTKACDIGELTSGANHLDAVKVITGGVKDCKPT